GNVAVIIAPGRVDVETVACRDGYLDMPAKAAVSLGAAHRRCRPATVSSRRSPMRELVRAYLDHDLSRRGFLRSMAAAGFTVAAAESVLAALAPAAAQTPGKPYVKPFEGTGGALLAEQLIQAGTEYLFVGNGSGLGALCDAVLERPQLKLVLATHEAHVVAMASGYAMATRKPTFCMYSRVGASHSSGNIYNAMKDRLPLVIVVDRADTTEDGRDGHEDLEDMLEPMKQYTKGRWIAKEGR